MASCQSLAGQPATVCKVHTPCWSAEAPATMCNGQPHCCCRGTAKLQGAHAAWAGDARQSPCRALTQRRPARLTSFCWSSCPSSSWSGWSKSSSSSSSSSCIVSVSEWSCTSGGGQARRGPAEEADTVELVQGLVNSSSGRHCRPAFQTNWHMSAGAPAALARQSLQARVEQMRWSMGSFGSMTGP